ncbi:MAG: phosphoenolpyruvate--protein phosphotransferase, partial [Acidobacteria bacterium]|nr:phosphoenolpyruvate--protein phosphotransferase [Acidobacteriota bacterium]
DRPAIIRTLDFGDERHPYFSPILGETETALGLRGIRLSLKYPEIFRDQVRAILRASAYGNLKIVLPMISSVDEVLEARRLIQAAQEELLQEGVAFNSQIEVGVMVEVPAAIILLEALCAHADFFAVGTNDLIQYTLAAGRADDHIADLFNPLHPAVLKSLARVARVAAGEDSMALVCGEIASHPVYARLLIGMGFRHLSMSPYAIPEVKQRLRETSYLEACAMVEDVLRQSTLSEVESCVKLTEF